MTICENCLGTVASTTVKLPFGPQLGGQREEHQDALTLCLACRDALIKHDFYALHERFQLERLITNGRKA